MKKKVPGLSWDQTPLHLETPPSGKKLAFFFFFFYSYVHKMFGSFLPPPPAEVSILNKMLSIIFPIGLRFVLRSQSPVDPADLQLIVIFFGFKITLVQVIS
jgi:hypothetical protein